MLSLLFQFLPPDHNLKEINHTFLICGHTHLEAVSMPVTGWLFYIGALQKTHFIQTNTILKANHLRYTKDHPGKLFYKQSFLEGEEFKVWNISKKTKGQPSGEALPTLEKLHNSSKKEIDIKSMVC